MLCLRNFVILYVNIILLWFENQSIIDGHIFIIVQSLPYNEVSKNDSPGQTISYWTKCSNFKIKVLRCCYESNLYSRKYINWVVFIRLDLFLCTVWSETIELNAKHSHESHDQRTIVRCTIKHMSRCRRPHVQSSNSDHNSPKYPSYDYIQRESYI